MENLQQFIPIVSEFIDSTSNMFIGIVDSINKLKETDTLVINGLTLMVDSVSTLNTLITVNYGLTLFLFIWIAYLTWRK